MAHYNLAIAEFHLERYPQSIQDHTQAIQYNSTYALTHTGRAMANTILGRVDQKESDFQRAVELGIESSDLLRQEIDQRRSQG